jgi:predicted secreted protein with PEFG-CTERM motif
MNGHKLNSSLTYALILTLVGSLFSMAVPFQPTFASHSDIDFDIDGIVFNDADDDVTISGNVDGGDENDEIEIIVHEAGSGSESENVELDNDGDFDFLYSFPSGADDGVYQVEFVFGNDDPVFGFFILDDVNDDLDVSTDDDTYQVGDDVSIDGNVGDDIFDSGINEVEITIIGPDGDDALASENVDVDNNGDFEYDDFSVPDNEDAHGWYAIIVEYDNEEQGWAIFEVEEESGGSGDNEIIASFTDATLSPGDEVVITGSVNENDLGDQEVILAVEDPGNDEIENDSVRPDTDDGSFEFRFDLDEEAETGIYEVTLQYEGYDDKTLTFSVSTSSSGGSGGSGGSSGSDGGLTAKLSKSSLLAGESLTVSGVVPSIAGGEDGVSITVSTPGNNFIAAKFPEPESDKTYSASFILSQSLAEDDDYRVIVSYDGNEVELSFDITGKATGSTGPITVKTDKTSYSSGSTVKISGVIADEILVPGQQIALQVFNPERAPYRFDPIEPEDDGSYSYSMTIGGPLGVTGEWEVKVTYNGQVGETSFDLTGGVAPTPGYDLKFEDQTFKIEYESDGAINSMYVRPAEKKLVVSIDGEEDGELTITLPREVIDAVKAGSDTKYIVTTFDTETGEEKQVDITESQTNAEERTIVIDYDAGTDLIEIQGTNVVPEFGALSAIVLAIAIFSIVAVTAKFSNKFSAFRHW